MKISKLWDSLGREKFGDVDELFLMNFREPGNPNNRLAAWDPFDKSMRYFKFLLLNQMRGKNEAFFLNYARIGVTSLGNPVTIPSPLGGGIAINLDHFLAIEEFTFLREHLRLEDINHVAEIGAGFGRTAQALIKLVPEIKKYTIIDIPEVLALSSGYLRRVLSGAEYEKLVFINALSSNKDYEDGIPLDLVINIDSFQEMPQKTVRQYIQDVVRASRFFYSKNPIGKYTPESVGIYEKDPAHFFDVFSLGLSTDVIDIFDEAALAIARKKHVEQYLPSESFEVISQVPLGIFPYYHNVLYGKIG